jgi:hypothetical protein
MYLFIQLFTGEASETLTMVSKWRAPANRWLEMRITAVLDRDLVLVENLEIGGVPKSEQGSLTYTPETPSDGNILPSTNAARHCQFLVDAKFFSRRSTTAAAYPPSTFLSHILSIYFKQLLPDISIDYRCND